MISETKLEILSERETSKTYSLASNSVTRFGEFHHFTISQHFKSLGQNYEGLLRILQSFEPIYY